MKIHPKEKVSSFGAVIKRTIHDFCSIACRMSVTDSHARTGSSDEIPYVKPWDMEVPVVLKTREAIPKSLVESGSVRVNLAQKDTVILQMEGREAGRVGWLGMDAVLSGGLCQIVPDLRICLPRFLYHALKSRKDCFLSIDDRFDRSRILPRDLNETTLALPSLDDQARIVRVLDAAESLCWSRKDSIVLLGKLIRSGFLEMFGDPDLEAEKWEMKQIGEFGEIEPPSRRFQSAANDPAIPYVQGSDLVDFWVSDTEKRVPGDNPQRLQFPLVPENSVVMAGIFGRYPKASILTTGAYVGQSCIAVRASETCIPEYLCMLLRLSGRRLEDSSTSTRGNDTRITNNMLRSFPVPFPPLSLQRRFADTARLIRKQILALTDILADSEQLYQSLLYDLIGRQNKESRTET